jgi:hypothetical protein
VKPRISFSLACKKLTTQKTLEQGRPFGQFSGGANARVAGLLDVAYHIGNFNPSLAANMRGVEVSLADKQGNDRQLS